MVEHLVYTEGVRSSSLLPRIAFRDRKFSLPVFSLHAMNLVVCEN
jgi:hypothetical protein